MKNIKTIKLQKIATTLTTGRMHGQRKHNQILESLRRSSTGLVLGGMEGLKVLGCLKERLHPVLGPTWRKAKEEAQRVLKPLNGQSPCNESREDCTAAKGVLSNYCLCI